MKLLTNEPDYLHVCWLGRVMLFLQNITSTFTCSCTNEHFVIKYTIRWYKIYI